MKFKQETEESNKNIIDCLIGLVQLKINQMTLIASAKTYFSIKGNMQYVKFLEGLCKEYGKQKCCLKEQIIANEKDIPELKIPQQISSFESKEEPFKALVELEDKFEEQLLEAINIAFKDNDWKNFYYLLKKLDTVDHICSKALAAIENKADLLALCEQHISEK